MKIEQLLTHNSKIIRGFAKTLREKHLELFENDFLDLVETDRILFSKDQWEFEITQLQRNVDLWSLIIFVNGKTTFIHDLISSSSALYKLFSYYIAVWTRSKKRESNNRTN